MSKPPWKPNLVPYEQRPYGSRASGSGSSSSYTPWSATDWNAAGWNAAGWNAASWNTAGQSSSTTGYYMPWGNYNWNVGMFSPQVPDVGMYATVPQVPDASWGSGSTNRQGTSGSCAGVPISTSGTSGLRAGVPTSTGEQASASMGSSMPQKQEKPTKEVSLNAALKTPTKKPLEEVEEESAEEESLGTYYPDPVCMRSRPYPYTENRPYPHLEKNKVIYKSERGQYPFSVVPRFPDVIKWEGFPETPTPPWVKPEDKPVHDPVAWRKAYTSKLVRQHQERRAFFERTVLPNAEAYPHPKECEKMDDLKDMTPFDVKTKCSLARWVAGANSLLQEYCYEEIIAPEEGVHYWCYVCGKAPRRDLKLARCAACGIVFMCMNHRIFPDCFGGNPNRQITICCRHSRYTPKPGSWNPRGGYPRLQDISETKLEEEWRDEGWVANPREKQLMGFVGKALTDDQYWLAKTLIDKPLTDAEAEQVIGKLMGKEEEPSLRAGTTDPLYIGRGLQAYVPESLTSKQMEQIALVIEKDAHDMDRFVMFSEPHTMCHVVS
eukprot:6405827-Amphidinium_carterae.4